MSLILGWFAILLALVIGGLIIGLVLFGAFAIVFILVGIPAAPFKLLGFSDTHSLIGALGIYAIITLIVRLYEWRQIRKDN